MKHRIYKIVNVTNTKQCACVKKWHCVFVLDWILSVDSTFWTWPRQCNDCQIFVLLQKLLCTQQMLSFLLPTSIFQCREVAGLVERLQRKIIVVLVHPVSTSFNDIWLLQRTQLKISRHFFPWMRTIDFWAVVVIMLLCMSEVFPVSNFSVLRESKHACMVHRDCIFKGHLKLQWQTNKNSVDNNAKLVNQGRHDFAKCCRSCIVSNFCLQWHNKQQHFLILQVRVFGDAISLLSWSIC